MCVCMCIYKYIIHTYIYNADWFRPKPIAIPAI